MADIELKGLYDQKAREFATQGMGGTRFASDFVDAVNRAIRRINRDANLETPIDTIANTEGTIGLDDAYEDVLSALVTVNLIDCGHRIANDKVRDYDRLKAEIPGLIDSIRRDLLNAENDEDSDDGVIGIGVVAR